MCNNCIHKAVCGKFSATGGHVRECEHYCKHNKLFDAMESIIWYDGHYEWLKELRDILLEYPKGKNYPTPDQIKGHSEEHTIWMLLVGMFGNWGTSIRCGWIEDIQGCIEFIDAVCKMSWDAEGRVVEDG